MWPRTALKALAVWAGILVLAIVNGVAREFVLLPLLGNPFALVASGVALATFILILAYLTLPWLNLRGTCQHWLVGVCWLALTLAFECTFGLLQGKSWPELGAAYAFEDGNLWPMVLAVLLVSPYLTAKVRRLL